MQAFKVIVLVACLAGVASAASVTSDGCELCKKDAEEMKKSLPKLEESMIAFCKQFPSGPAQDKCIAGAKELISKMSKETAEQICQDAGMCPRVLSSPDYCELCKKDAEQTKKTLPQLQASMIAACKKIRDQAEQNRCISAAKEYIDKLSKETPEQICQDTGMCPKMVPFALRHLDQFM